MGVGAFADVQFSSRHNLSCHQLRVPRALEVIDVRPILAGDITELVRVTMDIGGHREEPPAFVTSLGQYLLVLGIPWLSYHDVTLRFTTGKVTFASPDCLGRRMSKPIAVQGSPLAPPPPLEPLPSAAAPAALTAAPTTQSPSVPISISAIGAPAYGRMQRNRQGRYGTLQAFKLSLYDTNCTPDRDILEAVANQVPPTGSQTTQSR